ncbi:MAG: hypothetical protein SPK07_08715, partial [Coriobacteriales bacterium]|nr:hypothetical protein [Coriobacteriales bacterium]
MRTLLNSQCPFCSVRLDKTHYCKTSTEDGIKLALTAGAGLTDMGLAPEYVCLFDGSFGAISYMDSFGRYPSAGVENIPGIV